MHNYKLENVLICLYIYDREVMKSSLNRSINIKLMTLGGASVLEL